MYGEFAPTFWMPELFGLNEGLAMRSLDFVQAWALWLFEQK